MNIKIFEVIDTIKIFGVLCQYLNVKAVFPLLLRHHEQLQAGLALVRCLTSWLRHILKDPIVKIC
jgi:hypothetical protein